MERLAAPHLLAAGGRATVRRPARADMDPHSAARWATLLHRSLAVAVPVLLLAAWEWAGDARAIDVRYFPPPSAILDRWSLLIATGEYWDHLAASLSRILKGYLLGAVTGLVIGTLLGSLPLLRRALEPTLTALNTIPKLAILPLLLLLFGIGELTKVLVVALSTVFMVLLSTMYAVASVPQAYRETAASFGANRLRVLLHADLPAALPHIFTGLRLAASLAIVVIVGAEFVAANEGLGFMVWNSWNLGIPKDMFIGIVSMALLGVAAVAILQGLYRLIAPWER